MLTIIGAIGTAVLFFGARFLSAGSPGSYLSIITISPALLFIAMLSAFRGYFQGHSNMIPTAYSEVIEAVSKLVIGLLGAYFLMGISSEVAAAGAILADVWLDNVSMPVVDCLGDEFLEYVQDGMKITIKEDGVVIVE